MYKCQITHKKSKLGEKINTVVVFTRERTYTRWVRNEETNKWEEVFVAKGWEIVKEIAVSQEGLDLWNGWTSEQRLAWSREMFPYLFKNVA
jgi:hypothetical protein